MGNKKTCLYDRHKALGAVISPFGGFDMPIQYTNIIDEHNAVRHACGVFDVSHMGEVFVSGPDAERFVQHIFTNDISGAPAGKIFYGLMLYPSGGAVDDLLVYKLAEQQFLLVVNAANIEKDYTWMFEHADSYHVTIENKSEEYGQIAVQGPKAEAIIETRLGIPCSELAFYTFKNATAEGQPVLISRTGYTGEDGFEIYAAPAVIVALWDKLIASGDVTPCGLGCRDTLRFEVGLPLYGNELDADITPLEAGLGIFVKVGKGDFIGREAIAQQKTNGLKRKIVGIELSDKAIPRHGYEVFDGETAIGTVTTGYQSISTGKSVCMALVDNTHAALGTSVQVLIHKKRHDGVITKKRFYDKNYKK